MRKEVMDLLEPLASNPGGDKKSGQYKDHFDNCQNDKSSHQQSIGGGGNSEAYTKARLRRDHPELYDRVTSGELSPNAAAIEAGWRNAGEFATGAKLSTRVDNFAPSSTLYRELYHAPRDTWQMLLEAAAAGGYFPGYDFGLLYCQHPSDNACTMNTHRVLAIAMQKGGVGKTTVTRHLAYCLSQNYRVLAIDLDPQGSLTSICGVKAGPDLADVMGDTQPGKLALGDIIRNIGPGLDIAPASIALAQTESGLVVRRAREYVLQRALEPVAANYDYILIDCPPALGMLLSNALIASQWVITPVLLDAMSLHSIGLFLDSLSAMQSDYPKVANLLGSVIARSATRTTLGRDMLELMTSRPELRLFRTIIPATVRVEEAALMGQPIHEYDPTSPAALAYSELTKEVIDRGNT